MKLDVTEDVEPDLIYKGTGGGLRCCRVGFQEDSLRSLVPRLLASAMPALRVRNLFVSITAHGGTKFTSFAQIPTRRGRRE